jgi:RND family efflux transporter MFP subunit
VSTNLKSGPATASPATGVSRKWWSVPVALIVVAGVGAVLWRYHKPRTNASHAGARTTTASTDRSQSADAVRVAVVHPQRGGLTRTSGQVGTVRPFERVSLYAKVSGYLKWQKVDIGSYVKKQELLDVIDDPEVLKEAERAEKALKLAETDVGVAKAQVKAAEVEVSKAKEDVERFRATRRYREKELARYRQLNASHAIPQQVVDEYQEHFEAAVANEHAAEVAVRAAEVKVELAKADFERAKANVEVISETLAKDKVLVDYTKIVSPYDGVVTVRNFFVGDFIRSAAEVSSQQPLLTVERTDKMRVVTYVPDRDVPFVDVGDRAIVTLDALRDMKFEAKVSRFSYSEVLESRTMRTEIDLENPRGLLRDGMYGVATIILEENTSNLTIPSACLTSEDENGKASVFVVKDGRAREVQVEVGTDNGIRVEILKGLRPDELMIVPRGAVADGVPVIVEEGHGRSAGAAWPRAGEDFADGYREAPAPIDATGWPAASEGE